MQEISLTAVVEPGLKVAAGFTRLGWVRQQLLSSLGIDPYPGTLNLSLQDGVMRARWQKMKQNPGFVLGSPDTGQCDAICHPVRLNGRIYGAVIIPGLPEYPVDKIEIIAAVPLRQTLDLVDGAPVIISNIPLRACKALIMDLDGTLVDTIDAFYELACIVAAENDMTITREEVLDSLNHGTPFWETVCRTRDIMDRDSKARELTRASHEHWPLVIKRFGRLRGSVIDTIRRLKNDGFRLAIVTGSRGESLQLLLASAAGDLFDVVLSGADVVNKKPHPEGLITCMQRLGLGAHECVYIGDTVVDVHAARAAGMAAIGVLGGAGNSAQLSAAGVDRLIPGIEQIPGAVINR